MTNNQSSATSRRKALCGLACGAMVLAAPYVARASIRTIRIGHNNPDAALTGQGATAFAKAAAANPLLAETVKLEVFGNAQLGDDVTMLNACLKGTLDGMIIGSSILSNVVPEVGILNAPYLFSSATPARAVLDGPLGAEFSGISAAKGLPSLAWGENGLRHITSNKPVRTVADLRGLKIRVPQSEIMLAGMLALGAAAAPLSFTQLPDALRRGEFEAQENGISTVEASKLYEVQKYLCLTGHIYDAMGFIVSADLVEDLTPPQREALTACARVGAAATRQAADIATKEGVVRLRAAGMTIIEDIDVRGFQTAARPFIETLKPKFGATRVTGLLAASA